LLLNPSSLATWPQALATSEARPEERSAIGGRLLATGGRSMFRVAFLVV